MLRVPHLQQSRIVAWFSLLFGTMACVPDNEVSIVSGKEYFPLVVGDYRIYHVEETQVTPFNVEENFSYDLKTVVTDSFRNATGDYTYMITRFKRSNAAESWNSFDTWTARKTDQELVVSEGNVPFVKLVFPAQPNTKWNANAYNNLETNEFCDGAEVISCDIYTIENIEAGFETDGGLVFDNALEVIENNNPDILIEHDVRRSVYAWDVGLIFKEVTVLTYCTTGDCYGKQLVETGLIFKQELIEYGRE